MSKTFFIYSTLTASVDYTIWKQANENALPEAQEVIHVAGGANVANRKTLVTPTGAVITKVTEAQLEALNEIDVFKLHKKNGFIEIREHLEDGEAVASDMATKDESAPLVPEDFTGQELQPIVNGETVDVAPADEAASKRSPRKA